MKYRVKKTCFHNGSRYREGRVLSEGDDLPPDEYLVALGGEEEASASSSKLEVVKRQGGKWAVVDGEGNVVDSGLTKLEAMAKAGE